MVKLGIISDTHVVKGEDTRKYYALLEQLKNIFKDVDEIIHAGDVGEEWFLNELKKIAPIRHVRSHENNFGEVEVFLKFQIGAYNIGVIHEPPNDMESLFKQENLNILIHGHTHFPLIQSTNYKTLILNPGSPTRPSIPPQKRGFQKPVARSTVLTLNIDENDIISTYIITLKKTSNNCK